MEQLRGIKPNQLSPVNEACAGIAEMGLRFGFGTMGLLIDAEQKLRIVRAAEEVSDLFSRFDMPQRGNVMKLAVAEIEASSSTAHIAQRNIQALEEGIVDLYRLGAVEKARQYAEMYKALYDHFPNIMQA